VHCVRDHSVQPLPNHFGLLLGVDFAKLLFDFVTKNIELKIIFLLLNFVHCLQV